MTTNILNRQQLPIDWTELVLALILVVLCRDNSGIANISLFHGNLRDPPKATPPKKYGPNKALLRETNG